MTSVIINSDKTISIDGKKTFYIGITNICASYIPLTDCDTNIAVNNNALVTYLAGDSAYQTMLRPKLNANNILFIKNICGISEPDANGFLAYLQPDEATAGITNICPLNKTMTEEQMLATLLAYYNKKKNEDPNHPVVLGHWTQMTKWLPYADIMMWDTYTITNHSWQVWDRIDAIYAWEIGSWNNYFMGTELNQISKPVWTYIQANIDDPSWSGLKPTKQEARANTYAAITLDVKGIEYFGYMVMGDWTNVNTITGVYSDQVLAAYYNQLMGEIRSLNDILVLPTVDYGWTYHPGTKVTFNKNYTKTVWWKIVTNFNYMLKHNGNTWYIIVVNKDSRSISNVNITIKGMTGAMSARTLGLETIGSSRAGRVIAANNGQFTDSFDGLAVHIYEINSSIPCPQSQCDFTITQ